MNILIEVRPVGKSNVKVPVAVVPLGPGAFGHGSFLLRPIDPALASKLLRDANVISEPAKKPDPGPTLLPVAVTVPQRQGTAAPGAPGSDSYRAHVQDMQRKADDRKLATQGSAQRCKMGQQKGKFRIR